MQGMEYRPRIVDQELRTQLGYAGAVVIDGPKSCGKTATARRVATSEVRLDVDRAAQQLALIDPALLLEGDVPRLIDEWQIVPEIWNHVRRAVDDRSRPGQFVLTGSATPSDDITRHSGAGRFAYLRMRPMSLFESGASTGAASLSALLAGGATRTTDPGLSLDDLIAAVVRGGWPQLLDVDLTAAAKSVRDYVERIRRTDISAVDGVRRDPARVGAVLASLARNIGTQAPLTQIADDASGRSLRVSDETVGTYIDALERLMLVEQVEGWNVHLRSRHRLQATPTRQFVDPSIAVAALRARPEQLRRDPNYLGFLFESLVIRDLRVYAQPLGGEISRYRDKEGREIDAIVDCGDRWAAFEVKLGVGQIEQAATQLRRIVDDIDTAKSGEPALLGVIVANGYGYVRPDGIHVIPIGTLGP